MAILTRHAHYAALPPAHNRRDGHTWTQESALTALRLFLAEEGRYPTTDNLHAYEGLPNCEMVRKLFGSMRGFLQSVEAPPPAPTPYARCVACPRCGTEWPSPDVRQYRTCETCHADPTYNEGCWMTGRPVDREGMEEIAWWEMDA